MEQTNKKQFIPIINEESLALFIGMFPSLKFVEVQGMALKDTPDHMVIVFPTQKAPEEKPADA